MCAVTASAIAASPSVSQKPPMVRMLTVIRGDYPSLTGPHIVSPHDEATRGVRYLNAKEAADG